MKICRRLHDKVVDKLPSVQVKARSSDRWPVAMRLAVAAGHTARRQKSREGERDLVQGLALTLSRAPGREIITTM